MRVAVFCGSRFGSDPAFATIAAEAGAGIAQRGGTVVYGGGDVGLMGIVARSAQAAGGRVVGYIPDKLRRLEVEKADLSELHVTRTMFDRKERMIGEADAFLVLPGGLGTIDELLDAVTLRQLDYHRLPIVLLDHDGFWRPWLALVEHVVARGFAEPGAIELFHLAPGVAAALDLVLPARSR